MALEDAIWSAINALEERATTLQRFASRFVQVPRTRQRYLEQAETVQRQADLLREGLARVIEAETNGAFLPNDLEAEYPRTVEGGAS